MRCGEAGRVERNPSRTRRWRLWRLQRLADARGQRQRRIGRREPPTAETPARAESRVHQFLRTGSQRIVEPKSSARADDGRHGDTRRDMSETASADKKNGLRNHEINCE